MRELCADPFKASCHSSFAPPSPLFYQCYWELHHSTSPCYRDTEICTETHKQRGQSVKKHFINDVDDDLEKYPQEYVDDNEPTDLRKSGLNLGLT